jgi:hypothetical protein
MIASLIAPWVHKDRKYDLYDLLPYFSKAHIDRAVKVASELDTESLRIWPKLRRMFDLSLEFQQFLVFLFRLKRKNSLPKCLTIKKTKLSN